MAHGSGRIAAGLLILSAVWIGVYWWWPVEPPISFAQTEAKSTRDGSVHARESVRETPPPVNERVAASTTTLAKAPLPPAIQLVPADATAGVIAPTFFEDTIRAGDTFATIAQRHLGDATKADVIARANPLMSPLNLREGRTIRIPRDPANVQGQPVYKTADGNTTPAAAPAQASPVAMQEYTVQKGDSLAKIAKRVYGEERLANVIFEANRDVLADPSKIRIGQKLKLPAKPDAEVSDAGGGT